MITSPGMEAHSLNQTPPVDNSNGAWDLHKAYGFISLVSWLFPIPFSCEQIELKNMSHLPQRRWLWVADVNP